MAMVFPPMPMATMTETLLGAKAASGLTFAQLASHIGLDEMCVAAMIYGQASASPEEAARLCQALGLGEDAVAFLTRYPTKGCLNPVVPTDPLIYRFYEIMQVYGMPMKDVIQEKFGDGIMSAIDFTLHVDKVEDPKGERVKVVFCGKFLPYKKW